MPLVTLSNTILQVSLPWTTSFRRILLQQDVTCVCVEGDSHQTVEQTSAKEMWRRDHQNQSWWWEPDWPPTQVGHGDITNVSKEAQGIFLEQRWRLLLLGKKTLQELLPVSRVQLQSSWRAVTSTSTRTMSFNVARVYEHLWTSIIKYKIRLRCAKKLCPANTKKAFHIWAVTNGAFPYLICVCVLQTQIEEKQLSHSRLPKKV